MVRFVKNSLSFYQLNISRVDIPCVLVNGVGGAARPTQPVTLYITVNITQNLYNIPPSISTKDDDSPAEEVTIQGRIQFPVPEHILPLSHYQTVETGSTMTPSLEQMSPTSALHRTDEAMKRIIPIDRSNTWEGAVGKIKWLMDTLGPIAEVRIIPFNVPS